MKKLAINWQNFAQVRLQLNLKGDDDYCRLDGRTINVRVECTGV